MAQIFCGPHLKLCALRATRLNPDCTFATGPNNSVTTAGFVSLEIDPEIEEGEEITVRNGCGELCISNKDCDELKWLNLSAEICVVDIDLLNIIAGQGAVLNEAGDTIGACTPVGKICNDGAFIEFFAKVGDIGTDCPLSDDTGLAYPYVRYVLPRAYFWISGQTFENGAPTFSLEGRAFANPRALDGPFSDWPGVGGIPADHAQCWAYSTDLPETACGYQVDVPADANEALVA